MQAMSKLATIYGITNFRNGASCALSETSWPILYSCVHLFIWALVSPSTLYRSYHEGSFCGQRKPVHTVGQGCILYGVWALVFELQTSEVGGEYLTASTVRPGGLLCVYI